MKKKIIVLMLALLVGRISYNMVLHNPNHFRLRFPHEPVAGIAITEPC